MLKAVAVSLLLITRILQAQTPGLRPEDYFHLGATNYIFDKKEAARAATAEGLKRYPNDTRLKGLAGLAAGETPPPQPQQQQSQQGKSDQNKDQQNQQSQQQKEQQQAEQQTNQTPPQPQDASEQKVQKEAEAAAAAGQMTPEQARQLLDAQKSEEQLLPIKPKEKQVDRSRHFKDW